MRLTALTLAATFAFATPLTAQSTLELARQYAEMPEVQVMFDDMFAPEVLAEQFRLGVPAEVEISEAQLEKIGVVMAEMMAQLRPGLTEIMIDGMAKAFTAEEITALIDFYGSEHGAAVMRKMQPYMQDVMAQFIPLINAEQQKILPELVAIIQE
jgi:hypothetical protein